MGEFELIARIRDRVRSGAPSTGANNHRALIAIGDDAAVTVAPEGGEYTATSVDAAVEGVHFDLTSSALEDVGHKALASGLSDLAAMGVRPSEAYVVIGIPNHVSEDDCMRIFEGAAQLAERTGVIITGGDITRSLELFLAITVVGHSHQPPVTRAGARPGDRLLLTGEIGGAAAGLELLRSGDPSRLRQSPAYARLIARQLRPEPRLEAGRMLAIANATAMIDLSDGLGADAGHLAKAGGVRLEIDVEAVPMQAGVAVAAAQLGMTPLELATGGGEDYELLAAVPDEHASGLIAALNGEGISAAIIGTVIEGSGVGLRYRDGREISPQGFDQLESPVGPPA